ncbi:hypothetical protein BD324DRAFT_622820 [Kockovaella imperatae]|uniref:Kri1-like C-terminal domain-containing protein n=1 Tax=Kockovaella imperatae TaxID=4999 RepID=A0A1Y1UI63_9TREE|nr:hypothetical protein BD324DRAFT_622820 [Kockovaella imperatae]ORX37669.1 hypothetical protein BD324DRAFT_622820 [Kockovaella imperatae]
MAKGSKGKAYKPQPFIPSSTRVEVPVPVSRRNVDVDDSEDSGEESASSSEDVTEDEEGDELTPAMDAAILQTLKKIRSGRGVYEQEDVMAEALREAEERVKSLGGLEKMKREAKSKPVTVTEHRRAELLAELENDDTAGQPATYVESQRKIRQDAIEAFKSLNDEGDDEDEFDFTERPKTDADEEKEAKEYRQFLLEMGGGEDEVRKLLGLQEDKPNPEPAQSEDDSVVDQTLVNKSQEEAKRKKTSKKTKQSKQEADENFLMDYILNRGWIDRSDRHVPTYDEVVANAEADLHDDAAEDEPRNAEAGPSQPWGVLEEDEFDDKAEEFESAYNFRYEEPGAETIHTHPRNIDTLVRRTDDSRKLKRAAREERKEAERAAAEEKTRRKKGEKRREMETQLGELKKELGGRVNWEEVERVLEGDFDEDEWERVIGNMLAEAEDEDDVKPAWDDDDDMEYAENDLPDDGSDAGMNDGNGDDEMEDGPINMDADFIDIEPVKKKKKGKDKAKQKHREEPQEELSVAQRAERVKEAMEDYRALDHEDMIGDMPTRFKYTRSVPLDFGLTPVEMLLATDAELNAIAGMKHLAPYRQRKGFGRAGIGMDRRIRDLQQNLKDRKWGEEAAPQEGDVNKASRGSGADLVPVSGDRKRKGKRMGKNERKRARGADGEEADGPASASKGQENVSTMTEKHGTETGVGVGEEPAKKRRRKKKKHLAEATNGA